MVYKGYNYVIFSDLDIYDKESLQTDMICKKERPDFTDEYFPDKIFDNDTIKLLNIFGYVLANSSIFSKLDSNEPKHLKLIQNYYKNPSDDCQEINKNIYCSGYINYENSFLISKKQIMLLRLLKNIL